MLTKTTLGGVVYGRESWRPHASQVVRAIQTLAEAYRITPTAFVVDPVGGATPRYGPYDRVLLQAAIERDDTLEVSIEGPGLRIGLELPSATALAARTCSPPALFFAATRADGTTEPQAGIIDSLQLLARTQAILHGGVDLFDSFDAAWSDASLVGSGLHTISQELRLRWRHDNANRSLLWTHPRRLFALTVMAGPILQANDAAEAARAGAAKVHNVDDTLFVAALSDLQLGLDPNWRAERSELIAWLWPRTLRNPSDAPLRTKKHRAGPPARPEPRAMASQAHSHTRAL